MKKFIFGALFAVYSISGFSVLPPFYHSSKEVKTILEDERLHEKLGSGQLIQEIVKSDGGWLIVTPRYFLYVDVNYIPSTLIGHSEFELNFKEPITRDY